MSGLSFVQSGFLIAGAAAAALPILIHLLLRQRARMRPLGSVRFLKSVVRQHSRRRRIRQWILLAMRVLAVLLLAALFARPYWDRAHLEGRNREVVVLLDRSASMQARSSSGGATFDAALEVARRELSELAEDTIVHLGLFDAGGVVETTLQELRGTLRPSDSATDYGAALGWSRDLATLSERPERRVVLITDMQHSGLGRSTVRDFPADVDLVLRDVGRPLLNNVSLEDCRAVVTEIRPKDPVRVQARIFNAGALPVEKLQLKLQLRGPQGNLQASVRTTIAGGARETVELVFEQLQTDGVYSGKASFELADDLAVDNARWVAFEARHPDRLLLVDGQQGRSVYSDETYYLETALRLRAPRGERPGRSFEVERLIWEDGEGFPSLDGFRAIVLANVRRLSTVDIQRLRDYVAGGGNLLMFFGEQTTRDQVERLRQAGLIAASLGSEPLSGPWRIDRWDQAHDVLRPFADPQHGDLRRLRFDKLAPIEDREAETRVLIWAGERPLLLEHSLGEGTAMFFATAADRAWSDWPQHRLYVPLVRQMLAYLTNQLGRRRPVRQELVDREHQEVGVSDEQGVTVVRNLDPLESRLDRVTEEEFREAFGLAARDRGQLIAELSESIEPPPGVERPLESWDKVIWVLLILMSAELLLASRVHV